MGAACGHTAAAPGRRCRLRRAIGLAFQVVDDILDVTQASETLGKTAGKDLDANKPTYVTVLGLEPRAPCRRRCARRPMPRWRAAAEAQPAALALLADRVVERDN
jgi:farnesyl diphosphate synthase